LTAGANSVSSFGFGPEDDDDQGTGMLDSHEHPAARLATIAEAAAARIERIAVTTRSTARRRVSTG
jgi:hypothetical protein